MDRRLVECCYKYHGQWQNITKDKWGRHLKLNGLDYFPFTDLFPLLPELAPFVLKRKIKASIDWEFKEVRLHGPSLDRWYARQVKREYAPLRKALERLIEKLKSSG